MKELARQRRLLPVILLFVIRTILSSVSKELQGSPALNLRCSRSHVLVGHNVCCKGPDLTACLRGCNHEEFLTLDSNMSHHVQAHPIHAS